MTPGWVQDLQDYWSAAEGAIEESGGYLDDGFVVVQPIESEPDVWLGLTLEKQRLNFYDGSYLDFSLSVASDLSTVAYSFHYARWDHQLVWRHDKHHGHENEDGSDTHVHLPDEVRKPHEGADLFDVLQLVMQDQNDERRPPG